MARTAGHESFLVGDIRLRHLPDGSGSFDPAMLLPPSTAQEWQAYPQWLDDQGRLITTIGGLLIQTADTTILFDPGMGPRRSDFGALGWMEGGQLPASLSEISMTAGDIDIVAYSHLHIDHIGWTVGAEPGLTFPNARHVVVDQEWDYWSRSDNPLRAATGIDTIMAEMEATVELVDSRFCVADGVELSPAPGHTPGHAILIVESGSQRALLLGDSFHSGAQVSHCGWHCVGDVDSVASSKTRERLVHELSGSSTFGVAAHFPNTLFGRVEAHGETKRWVETPA